MTTGEEWGGGERVWEGNLNSEEYPCTITTIHHILALDPNPNKPYTEQPKTPNLKVRSGDETQGKGREPSEREAGRWGSPGRVARINKQGVHKVATLNPIILKHLQN